MKPLQIRFTTGAVLCSALAFGVASSVALAEDSPDQLVPQAPAAAPSGMPTQAPPGGWPSAAGRAEIAHLADSGVLPSNGTYVPLPTGPQASSSSTRARAVAAAAPPPPGFRCIIRAYPPYRTGPFIPPAGYFASATSKNKCVGVLYQEMSTYLQEHTHKGWFTRDTGFVMKPGPGTLIDHVSAPCIFNRDWRARAYGLAEAPNGQFYAGYNPGHVKRLSC